MSCGPNEVYKLGCYSVGISNETVLYITSFSFCHVCFKQIRQPSVREGIKMISNHITNFNDMICLGQSERKPSHDYPNKSSSCFAQFLRCSASPWMILSRPVFCLLITVSILPATTETPSAISSSKTHLPQAFTGDSSLLLLPYIYFYFLNKGVAFI